MHATGLLTFDYKGKVIPIAFEGSSMLKKANIRLWSDPNNFRHVCTVLPKDLPCLEELYTDVLIQTEVCLSLVPTKCLFVNLFFLYLLYSRAIYLCSHGVLSDSSVFNSNHKFNYLRHVKCMAYVSGGSESTSGVLQLASILEVAPVLQKLELHVSS